MDDLTDAELAPRLEALFFLGWAENYSSASTRRSRTPTAEIAIARAIGEGRLLVPLMLTKGYPFEAQGRIAEATAVCEEAVEAARLAGNPHYLFWALFELGPPSTTRATSTARSRPARREACAWAAARRGTIPAAGRRPGWLTANARFWPVTSSARGRRCPLGSDELEHKIPVERCFDWEILALVEVATGDLEAADGYVRRAEQHAERLGLELPRSLAERARAAVLLAAGRHGEAARRRRGPPSWRPDRSRAGRRPSRGACGARRSQRPAGATAVAVLRAAEAELDRYGAARARDELRRDLRRWAPAPRCAARDGGRLGVASLTKRELEIAGLVTDRRTNREIAQTLFLGDKTVESHLRNIFAKLGVSSRVDVARLVERERS